MRWSVPSAKMRNDTQRTGKMLLQLYADLMMDRISEGNFNQMRAKIQREQVGLKQRIARQRRELAGEIQGANDACQWTEATESVAP